LRFPFDGIWELPIAAHEFGHYVAPRLREGTPGGSEQSGFVTFRKEYLTEHLELGEVWESYLEELFADVFATYTVGPAFAFACLLLRFDPADPGTDGVQHPSYARRTHAILYTLALMNNEANTAGHFKDVIEGLRECWNGAVTSNGANAAAAEPERIEYLADQFFSLLRSAAPYARFTGWKEAICKAGLFSDQNATPDGENLIELFNAAWLRRLTEGVNAAEVSATVLKACRKRLEASYA
jgi:hypothetical protein